MYSGTEEVVIKLYVFGLAFFLFCFVLVYNHLVIRNVPPLLLALELLFASNCAHLLYRLLQMMLMCKEAIFLSIKQRGCALPI